MLSFIRHFFFINIFVFKFFIVLFIKVVQNYSHSTDSFMSTLNIYLIKVRTGYNDYDTMFFCPLALIAITCFLFIYINCDNRKMLTKRVIFQLFNYLQDTFLLAFPFYQRIK